jgi:hypothetical protein
LVKKSTVFPEEAPLIKGSERHFMGFNMLQRYLLRLKRLVFSPAWLALNLLISTLLPIQLRLPVPARRKSALGWKLALQTRAGKAYGLLLFWPLWENFTRRLWRLQPVPDGLHRLLEVRFTRYTGRGFVLPDGTRISKGDPVLELHFRNRAFLEVGEHAPAWQYMHLIAQNLSALACWMQRPDFPGEPLAIRGTTLLYRGAPRLGFVLRRRPKNMYTYLERFFMTGLLVLYHRQGGARLLQGTTYGTYAQEVWMSREALLKRYRAAQ